MPADLTGLRVYLRPGSSDIVQVHFFILRWRTPNMGLVSFSRNPPAVRRLPLLALTGCAVLAVNCSPSQSVQASRREAPAKAVQVEAVREETVRRTIEVVGTLAAEDEVTVSSQAEGIVRRVLEDLGDSVRTDQPLVEVDREKQQYNHHQHLAAIAPPLSKYDASELSHLTAAA